MKITLGEFRATVNEAMSIRPTEYPDEWEVTADMIAGDYMNFTMTRKGSRQIGYSLASVWAPFQALKDSDLSWVRTPLPKESVYANDMLEVLKTGQSLTTKTGVRLRPEQNLQEKVALLVAKKVVEQRPDLRVGLIVTLESSSTLLEKFATALGQFMGVKVIVSGAQKTKNPNRPKLNKSSLSGQTLSKAEKDLERWREKTSAGKSPSIRSTFNPKVRKHFSDFIEMSPELEKLWVDHPDTKDLPTVLVVDDIVTTGTSHRDAARELNDAGFTVAGSVAMFKEG